MRLKKQIIALSLGLAIPVAQASTIFTLDSTIGNGSNPIAATAQFTWIGNVLQIEVTNDTASIGKTIQELTGIHLVLSGAQTILGVSGHADGGSVNCIGVGSGVPCPTYAAGPVDPFSAPPDLDGHGAAPDPWGLLPGSGSAALFALDAGEGSWKPYGIVNDSIVGTGNGGNTSNQTHNPFLVGPVYFDLLFASFQSTPNVTGVDFYWGTSGDHRAGSLCTDDCGGLPTGGPDLPAPVPEPQTPALLMVALAALIAFRRKHGATNRS